MPPGNLNYDKPQRAGKTEVFSGKLKKNYRKASLWAENCPNFSFLFGPGRFNYD
jgi:hypothetical protein